MDQLVIVSGYFNPVHIGHVKYLEAAKSLGGKLLVIVNNDVQQILKKGRIIIPEEERLYVVAALKPVDHVILSIDTDSTVCKTLEYIAINNPNQVLLFGNGGDRFMSNIPEVAVCDTHSIQMVFNLGGPKTTSSSEINLLISGT